MIFFQAFVVVFLPSSDVGGVMMSVTAPIMRSNGGLLCSP